MNRASLIARLRAKGLDFLTTDEAGQIIDQAVEDTGNKRRWTYRMGTVVMTGAEITESEIQGSIVAVNHDGRDLPERSVVDVIAGRRGTSAQDGSPAFWFRENGVLHVEPRSSGATIIYAHQNHWTVGGATPADDSDTPRLDDDYHDVILLRARALALEETEEEAASVHYHSQWEAGVIDAAEKLLVSNPGRMRIRQTQEWA